MKKVVGKLTLVYYCIYFVAILLAVGGHYSMNSEEALIAEYGRGGTTITSVYLIYLVISIPLALRMFNTVVKKLSGTEMNSNEKIKKYAQYSFLRLIVIAISLFVGIVLYYVFDSFSMMYCAGIAAIALVFCKPSENKITVDLGFKEQE